MRDIYFFISTKNSLPQFCDGLFLCLYEEYFERHCITIPRQNQYSTLTAFQFIAKKFIKTKGLVFPVKLLIPRIQKSELLREEGSAY